MHRALRTANVIRLALALGFAFFFGSCRELAVVAVDVAVVDVIPVSQDIPLGEARQYTARPEDGEGRALPGRAVSWRVGDASIAEVSDAGFVTGLRMGVTTVVAEVEGQEGQAVVTVTAPSVASVEVSPAVASLRIGDNLTLEVELTGSDGSTLTSRLITWSSSQPSVADVDGGGRVSAFAVGTATITASSEGKSGSATITVTRPAVTRMDVVPAGPNVELGGQLQLTAIPRDSDGSIVGGLTIVWSSANATIASVDANGVVTGRALGATQIRATADGQTGQVTVTVTPRAVARVLVAPGDTTIMVNATAQLRVRLESQDGTDLTGRPLAFTSSNTAIAQVSATGLVRGIAQGSAVVTASAEGRSGTSNITVVTQPVANVETRPDTATLFVGDTLRMTVSITASDGTPLTGRATFWSSLEPAVATVGGTSGLVNAVSPGIARIVAIVEGVQDTARITVLPKPVSTVTITPANPTVVNGGTLQLQAVLRAADGTVLSGRPVAWSTSNASIADVDANGLVTAKALGTVTITAASEGQTGQTQVTVAPQPVNTVTVTCAASDILAGDTTQCSAELRDINGTIVTGRAVAWSTNDPLIATVSSSGLVLGAGQGSATITAESEGKTGSAIINVTRKPVAKVTVSPASTTLDVNGTVQLNVMLEAGDGSDLTNTGRVVTWAAAPSGDVLLAPATGIQTTATAVSATCPQGQTSCTVTITATSESVDGMATITVNKPVGSVTVTPAQTTLDIGGNVQVTAQVLASDGTDLTSSVTSINWTSGSANVTLSPQTGAQVTATAVAATCTAGQTVCTTTITASAGGQNGTASVAVRKAPNSVSVTPPSSTLDLNGSVSLVAKVLAQDGTDLTSGHPITWSSGSGDVTLSSTNQPSTTATAVSATCPVGTAVCAVTVTASAAGLNGNATVSVRKPVQSVTVSPANPAVSIGGSIVLSATLLAPDGTNVSQAGHTVSWSRSSNDVTLNPTTGPQTTATGVAASCGTGPAACNVTVTASVAAFSIGNSAVVRVRKPVATVTVAPPSATLDVGDTSVLAATLAAADGSDLTNDGRKVDWAPASADVTVNPATGVQTTATAAGASCAVGQVSCTTNVVATAEGKSGSAAITVRKPPSTVNVAPAMSTVDIGEVVALTSTVTAADGTDLSAFFPVTWSSASGDLLLSATTGSAVNATANSASCPSGTPECAVIVTADAGSVSGTATVAIRKPVGAVTINAAAPLTIAAGTSQTVTVTVEAADGTVLTNRSVTWSSADDLIATVTASGTFGLSADIAGANPPMCPVNVDPCVTTITAEAEGVQSTLTVQVPKTVASVNLTLSGTTISRTGLTPGVPTSLTATAMVLAADGTVLMRPVTWTLQGSSPFILNPTTGDTTVITVDLLNLASQGRVRATAGGITEQSGMIDVVL
jgi:uncharacterized protein YjdB